MRQIASTFKKNILCCDPVQGDPSHFWLSCANTDWRGDTGKSVAISHHVGLIQIQSFMK